MMDHPFITYIDEVFFPPLREQDIVVMSYWKDYTCERVSDPCQPRRGYNHKSVRKVKGVRDRNLNPNVILTRTDRVLAPAR